MLLECQKNNLCLALGARHRLFFWNCKAFCNYLHHNGKEDDQSRRLPHFRNVFPLEQRVYLVVATMVIPNNKRDALYMWQNTMARNKRQDNPLTTQRRPNMASNPINPIRSGFRKDLKIVWLIIGSHIYIRTVTVITDECLTALIGSFSFINPLWYIPFNNVRQQWKRKQRT